MKKLILVLLSLILLLSGCSAGKAGVGANEFSVYRVVKSEYRTDGELVRSETVKLSEADDSVQSAVLVFSSFPRDDMVSSALPENVDILSAEQVGSAARVTLSEGYRTLHGMEKTLLDYCLTLTLCSLPNIDSISIYVGQDLLSRGLSPDSVVLSNSAVSSTEVGVRIYFPNTNGSGLGYEYRELTLSEDASAERLVMDELLAGPTSSSLLPALNADCVLLAVYTTDGVCSVSFAEGFLSDENLTDAQIKFSIYSIVNSLTALSDVSSVHLLIEGKAAGILGGVDASRPLPAKNI